MDARVNGKAIKGTVHAPASKSEAHRNLICAAFANADSSLYLSNVCDDVSATIGCLERLGVGFEISDGLIRVHPVSNDSMPNCIELDCADSASTARFMVPILAMLGIESKVGGSKRLLQRDFSQIIEALGIDSVVRDEDGSISIRNRFKHRELSIDASNSSQFVSGLIMAYSICGEGGLIAIKDGKLASEGYVFETIDVLSRFGGSVEFDGNSTIAVQPCCLKTPGRIDVEGDWSAIAPFAIASRLGMPIEISGLNADTKQPDSAVGKLMDDLDSGLPVSARCNPDLIPYLAVYATSFRRDSRIPSRFTDIDRLRDKESDRVESTASLIETLGGKIEIDDDEMRVYKDRLTGAEVDSRSDHRIAMAATLASCVCEGDVVIRGADCVSKSYPEFFHDFESIGGLVDEL